MAVDDLLHITSQYLYADVSRTGIARLPKREGTARLENVIPKAEGETISAKKTFTVYEPGFVHVDIKYLPQMPDETSRSLFVAIDRATRWVFLHIYDIMSVKFKSIFCIGSILFAFVFSGCRDANTSIELCGLNYTSKHIDDFSVNGYSGASIYANGGGGSFVCCVSLPRRWNKDLKVTVRWNYDDKNPGLPRERVVAVPEYSEEDIGFFAVHFYPDDTVEVLVTTKTSQYPGYPYPRPSK